jgi:hypothetical protein
MTRTNRRTRAAVLTALLLALAPAAARPATAAPPWLERLRGYRILDASGRITPRAVADGSGRVVLRPANPPSILMRGRPFYLSGYAGARYGPAAPLSPTGYHAPAAVGHGHGPMHAP